MDGGEDEVGSGETLRGELIGVSARFAARARKRTLHLRAHWPWQIGWKACGTTSWYLGERRIINCDTLVLTGDWIPDHELARSAGLDMDSKKLGPLVDTALRASRPGVFAIGNLLHPVDTADIAALDGQHVARHVRDYLAGHASPADGIRILADPLLRWIAPGILRTGDPAPARHRLLMWTDAHPEDHRAPGR